VRPQWAGNIANAHATRPNHNTDSNAPATISMAASNASSAVSSVSRVWVCSREPSFW
jgi:hypothetical protein